MTQRLAALQTVDPLSVPLPNGTQVTLRVDVATAQRSIPRGTVGRVVATHERGVDVLVVGMGTHTLRREDVTPHKAGQLAFAQQRQRAWDALRPNVVLEAVVGSRAWGLAHDTSDTDHRGVMVLPLSWTLGLQAPPTELVSLDGSDTYWSVDKAVRQGLRADPNTLEMLFVDGVTAHDEMGQWLLDERDAFVSRLILGSFGRYALSQLSKLHQSLRLANHRTLLLDWLRLDPAMTLDDAALRLRRETLAHVADDANALLQAKTYIKQLYRSLFDQGLLAAADFVALQHFAAAGARDVDLPRELRPKNAYNLLRLIFTAERWLRTGVPDLVVAAPQRERLLAIKNGAVALEDVLQEAQAAAADLTRAEQVSPLPSLPDVSRANNVLRRICTEAARRGIHQVVGPFGRDAPAPPDVQWEEGGTP